jgi:hypothetical protein
LHRRRDGGFDYPVSVGDAQLIIDQELPVCFHEHVTDQRPESRYQRPGRNDASNDDTAVAVESR